MQDKGHLCRVIHICCLRIALNTCYNECNMLQRFLPSEFGHDVDRADPVEPGLAMYKQKRLVRRVIEESGVPYTYICCNSIASWPYYDNCHPSQLPPPLDQLHIYGHGNVKGTTTLSTCLISRWFCQNHVEPM